MLKLIEADEKYLDQYKEAYIDRAKLYREIGKTKLAEADEKTVKELESKNFSAEW